jgi:hypothetical protein
VNDSHFIAGANALTHIYGEWPTFHDAELLRIEMQRSPLRLILDVLTQQRPPALVVQLVFDDIEEVELGGFNNQNVLFALHVDQAERDVAVTLYSSYGLGGTFRCRGVTVAGVREP